MAGKKKTKPQTNDAPKQTINAQQQAANAKQ